MKQKHTLSLFFEVDWIITIMTHFCLIAWADGRAPLLLRLPWPPCHRASTHPLFLCLLLRVIRNWQKVEWACGWAWAFIRHRIVFVDPLLLSPPLITTLHANCPPFHARQRRPTLSPSLRVSGFVRQEVNSIALPKILPKILLIILPNFWSKVVINKKEMSSETCVLKCFKC